MDAHTEEASQQHLSLMCSIVAKQQQQIVSMIRVINNLAVNQSGKLIVIRDCKKKNKHRITLSKYA